jgi:hypothetical protein
MTLATATYLALVYSPLPEQLPVRYLGGVPVYFQLKTPVVVMLPSIVQTALLLTFGAIGLLLLWRAQPDSRDLASEIDGTRMRLAVQGVTLLGERSLSAVGCQRREPRAESREPKAESRKP